MANLSDKNFPDDLKLELRSLAIQDHLTVEKLTRAVIKLGLGVYKSQLKTPGGPIPPRPRPKHSKLPPPRMR